VKAAANRRWILVDDDGQRLHMTRIARRQGGAHGQRHHRGIFRSVRHVECEQSAAIGERLALEHLARQLRPWIVRHRFGGSGEYAEADHGGGQAGYRDHA